ncbi:MAG TPA: hypothetical protein VJ901_09665 [Thermoanaerobaculia bacterium]|nr:hypothetical protein [Thermoanaerobaculia bacterium]
MPPTAEIVGILIAIFAIWIVLKLAKIAFRLIVFIIGVLLILGAAYYVFMR